jgi:DNA repair protein RecN (Recombination protein N)
MLTGLSIRDVVLIASLDLEIEGGFTALTGETGAGKSILLDALGLTLGERAERGVVRAGADRAMASAAFDVGENHPVHGLLADLGLDAAEEGRIVLRRVVQPDGRSKAWVNDAPASVGALKQLGAMLLEVHGQHASVGLMEEASHLGLLDQFAKSGSLLEAVREAWQAQSDARAAHEAALARLARAGSDRDYIAHMVAELLKLAAQPGEEATLDNERRALMGTEKVATALKDAAVILDEGTIETRLTNAAMALDRAGPAQAGTSGTLADLVATATAAIDRALNEIADAQTAVQRATYSLDADPGRLDLVEERLFALRAAARKHGVAVDDLSGVLARAQAELAAIDDGDAAVIAAGKALKAAEAAYARSADSLSQHRAAAATALDAAVSAELPPLKLEKCRFRTRILASPDHAGRNGWDRVAFEIAPNPGAGFGPLSAIASGGELSRLSLALKVVLAADGGTLALVFDEVDQGIGGATADAVGRRLGQLSSQAQVLCVTHSPQVAARADHHWRIEKAVAGGVTTTSVRVLVPDEREDELARMLAGEEITDAARAAARALVTAG